MCASLPATAGSGANVSQTVSVAPPPKPTSGLFIVFVKALILLIEGLFVCLLACMWAVAGNTRPRWKKSCSLLL